MGIVLLKIFFTLCIVNVFILEIVGECPNKCICKRSNQADTEEWAKIRCGDTEKVQSLDELDLNNIASEIAQLNLSGNSLTLFSPKTQFIALTKLDISKNEITALSDSQFIETPNLRRLDISTNNIKSLTKDVFRDLSSLERLKLNQNQITTIEKGTFDNLDNLKQIDISNNPLTCDCELLWLLEWAERTSVKLISNPKCASPASFKGVALKKLKIGVHVHCKSPAGNREMPLIELTPNLSQVVFEGDSLRLNCRAPSLSDTYNLETKDQIEWVWLDKNPKEYLGHIEIENRFLEDSGLIDSSLTITELNTNHSGIWNCHLVSNKQNESKRITILVISNETEYCQGTQTTNNKGTYYWPKTVVNNTVSLPCESIQQTNDVPLQRASYFCSPAKKWEFLNTSKCSFISDTTKILEQFSKVNLSIGKGGIVDSAKHFKNYIADLNLLRDVADLVFAVRTIENYLQFVGVEKELGSILMDVSSSIMRLNASYIEKACTEDNSCSKLVGSLEKIADYTLSPSLQKPNIALEVFTVNQRNFPGMTCTWYSTRTNRQDRKFYCIRTNQVPRTTAPEKAIEASIQIPPSFFYNLERQDLLLNSVSNKILVSVFSDAKLFPIRRRDKTIISGVAGVKLDNFIVHNLTEPITVMLRSTTTNRNSDIVPVWWDASRNNGTGEWTNTGCDFIEELDDSVIFRCDQLGYYSLKQNVSSVKNHTKFKFSHPAIYIGSLILFLCLLTSILTYIFCYAAIQMPNKAKHSLINIWISISLLCFIYVFGIYQTEDLGLCQIVGLILHYLTLSSILWVCVGVNGMYKRLRKNDRMALQDDDLPSEEPVRKPIIGLYFVGWGVALIVCGISSAVNMKEYASQTYCFLNSEPALSALYVPFAILIVTLIIYFSLIRCAMYSVDSGGHLSEGTQATENVDIDLLDSNFPNIEIRSAPSISTKTGSSELEDPEHSPIVQLKSYIIFLFLYVITWISCALSTIQPQKLRNYEEIFCVLYAVSCIILGSFTVFFYCIARNDVRSRWVKNFRGFRSRNISDTVPQIQIQPLPAIPIVDVTSRSSSRSSQSRMKAADLNSSNYSDPRAKVNNVNLVMFRNRTIVPNLIENPTNSAEMFYNPHQSTVARKFFRKQKQNMIKRNNIVTKRSEMNDNSSVASYPKQLNDKLDLFSSTAKVNNTNIHVEKVRKTKNRNPNIFLESSEDVNRTYKDRKHKKRQNSVQQDNNMRSVSQQCTLEYSSEPISDSILDQKSPEKYLMIPDNAAGNVEHVNQMLHTLYEPSEGSSVGDFVPPRIYVNPSHELLFPKSVQSRASSVSASEIDELYQDIRRGGKPRQASPCFSDSEITSAAGEVRYRCRRNFFDDSDKVESRV